MTHPWARAKPPRGLDPLRPKILQIAKFSYVACTPQKVQLQCHYGTQAQKPCKVWFQIP